MEEGVIQPRYTIRAGKNSTGYIREPIARLPQCQAWIATVRMNIHPRQIRNETLIAIRFYIEDQQTFILLLNATVSFGSEKDAQL